MIRVSSSSNDHFRRLSSLATSKGLRKHGEFLLMGERLVREFLERPGRWKIKSEIVREGLAPLTKSTVFEFSKDLFGQIDVLGTDSNLLALEVPDLPLAPLGDAPQGLELICPLGDPSNLGAVMRSALAFGASRVIFTEEAANPFHPKAVKASAGAVLRLNLARSGSSLAGYQSAGASYALDLDGRSLDDFAWPTDVRLIVGEEGPGLPPLPQVPRLSIPTGPIESLNAAVAASLAMDSWRRSRRR